MTELLATNRDLLSRDGKLLWGECGDCLPCGPRPCLPGCMHWPSQTAFYTGFGVAQPGQPFELDQEFTQEVINSLGLVASVTYRLTGPINICPDDFANGGTVQYRFFARWDYSGFSVTPRAEMEWLEPSLSPNFETVNYDPYTSGTQLEIIFTYTSFPSQPADLRFTTRLLFPGVVTAQLRVGLLSGPC